MLFDNKFILNLKTIYKAPEKRNLIFLVLIVFSAGFMSFFIFENLLHMTSTPGFCMRCHEMKIVGEQGWKLSPHYSNSKGVVAGCGDCHIPPGFLPMIWTKTRDGSKDIFVHFLGESDPYKMNWEELGKKARGKIYDSSCSKCHINLTPKGAEIKTIVAHRAYLAMKDRKKCLDCHLKEFHGEFKIYFDKTDNVSGEVAQNEKK